MAATSEFITMAKRGRVHLFGDGKRTLNPIHGSDLAKVIVDNIHLPRDEIDVGGSALLSQNDIARLAFNAINQPVKIVHIPDWIRSAVLWWLRAFTPSTFYGPLEFFMTTMVTNMDAPQYGECHLKDYFKEKAKVS